MKDVRGIELEPGQLVVWAASHGTHNEMVRAKVVSFTTWRVRIHDLACDVPRVVPAGNLMIVTGWPAVDES